MGSIITDDGVVSMVSRDEMTFSARKLRDTYEIKADAPFYHKTFGLWMCLESWYENGLDRNTDLNELFMFDEPGFHALGQLGWCEAAFCPQFDSLVLEDRGEHEVVQDFAGRSVLYFKGKRQGFMPEYIDHPVKDMATWEKNVKWRLDPDASGRFDTLGQRMEEARSAAAKGLMIQQNIIGGYMYLRSLMGPEDIMYVFYDKPDLVHDCMKTWLKLADAVTAAHQKYVTFDEIFLAEDICYNHGPLVSPDMMREFLFPYYQQLISNIKSRQIDKDRRLYIQVDTDGDLRPVIDVYRENIGMDMIDPFEVASGCDVVEITKGYPWLIASGGIDKRVLSEDFDTIDRYLEGILPVMRKRGGYIPTCDHGVPSEVPWQNYLHYRKRCVEYGS
ncbi:MAG: uroporphyrinogen decarboxylase family protein [Sedimentisphaeraceae bacterium JB056]